MPINAKIKKTGELFEAINEENKTYIVYELEEGKLYSGYIYPGYFDSTKEPDGTIVFKCTKERIAATLSTDELERITIPIRIRDRKRKEDG